ncbi:MAG: ribose-5-phosphate isomerase RpiA [Pseudomonadota bacterium]
MAEEEADRKKMRAAEAALDYVEDGMILGLGTGSTAAHFVRGLGARVREGLRVAGVPTSEATRALAVEEGVDLADVDETTRIDLTVDGADEVDGALNLIKGGGGALLREKIVAYASARMIVIADDTKHVSQLGAFPLPVEVTPYAWQLTVQALRRTFETAGITGAKVRLRAKPEGGARLTDGGNFVFDCALGRIPDPAALSKALNRIPGVVENGLFIDLADRALLGTPSGVRELEADKP